MNYLDGVQLLFMHDEIIRATGGSGGLRDLGLVESALAQPQMTFDGEDLYPDLYTKAAALLNSLVRNHGFIDGNKRVGIAAADQFLQLNGFRLTASQAEVVAFTLRVADQHVAIEEIARWLEQHSRPLE